MTDFLCPKCGEPLKAEAGSMRCLNGHCYDIARKGYVNLLQSSRTGHHGDDKLMVKARTDFLNKGYYDPLSQAICDILAAQLSEGACIVDAGCGDGKYTADIEHAMSALQPEIIGFDISKFALEALSRRSRTIRTAVAGTSAMPLPNTCADAVLNIFSPLFTDEFRRVLKPDGLLIRAIPLENHLWELKQAVYDHPYKNDIPDLTLEGFQLEQRRDIRYRIILDHNADILALFQMTPYYYKTGAADQKKLASAESMNLTLEFGLLSYRKNV